MAKNIVICLDGTWNDKEDRDTLTNVARLHEMSQNDSVNQITYYDQGVGTSGWYDKKLGGVHGVGLSENIRQAYTYLSRHYADADAVFIFGFSRGAYTARSLAGLVYRCGLLPASDHIGSEANTLYDAYKDHDNNKMDAYNNTFAK